MSEFEFPDIDKARLPPKQTVAHFDKVDRHKYNGQVDIPAK
jgi:hypothetical protein